MALQLFDGFDDYGTTNQEAFNSLWANTGSGGVASQIAGLFSGYGVRLAGVAGGVALVAIPSPVSEVIVGARHYPSASGPTVNGLILTNYITDLGGTPTLFLQISQTYPAPLIRLVNSAGTVLATASPTIMNIGMWYEIEIHAVISTSSGSAIVKINGVTVISISGVDTQGSSPVATIGAAGFVATQSFDSCYFDDFYVCDTTGSAPYNTFLSTVAGPMGPRVYTVFPNSDSSPAWTPLTGSSNFAMVDEQSFDGDTTYVYSSTASQQDLYGLPAITNLSGILGVKTSYVARMDDAGTREVAGSIKSGGTVYQGVTTTVTGNYQKVDDYYLVDPATSSAWSPTKFTTAGDVFIGVECVE